MDLECETLSYKLLEIVGANLWGSRTKVRDLRLTQKNIIHKKETYNQFP